jgi:hypothetical protein
MRRIVAVLSVLVLSGCAIIPGLSKKTSRSFADDLAFLQKYTHVIVLSSKDGSAQVAVCPELQGRVMTSTAAGLEGQSFGWINRDLLASGKTVPHFNPYGGEDRIWLGPEGGQFSIFFAKGVPFDLAHWFTPAPLDTESFDIVKKSENMAAFRKKFSLTNYSGSTFDVVVNRRIRLLDENEIWQCLGMRPVPGVKAVAFETDNNLTNAGKAPWKQDTGLLSIWILGMFNPSPATTVVIPINPGPEKDLGKVVTDDYFGKVPANRLVVRDKAVFFKADGKCRSKIGFAFKRCRGLLGSYDAANKVLTLAQYTLPKDAPNGFVNSEWKIQANPFGGDMANSYNDGPATPGAKPMGPFYELESSSPAAALAPDQSAGHIHRTIHIQGNEKDLNDIAQATLGVSIKEITSALP